MKKKSTENDCPHNSMPVCQYYLEGRCNSDSCPYRHINVGSDAQICPQFNRGFCPNGDQCKRKHLFVVRKRDKTKSKTKLKSQKSVKKSIKSYNTCIQSENQCLTEQSLPQFIAISNANDNNFKPDSNPFADNNCQQTSEQTIEQTVVNNTNNNNRNNRKDKYFWLDCDEELSIDSESTEQLSARRPNITIVPKFLFS